MELKTTYGAWACVAGAGEGLGAAFAFGLARRGFNLILIDLDPEKLSEVEAAIRRTHAVQLVALCVDLVDRESIQPIMAAIAVLKASFSTSWPTLAIVRCSSFSTLASGAPANLVSPVASSTKG